MPVKPVRKQHNGMLVELQRQIERITFTTKKMARLGFSSYQFLQNIVWLGTDYHAAFGRECRDSLDATAA